MDGQDSDLYRHLIDHHCCESLKREFNCSKKGTFLTSAMGIYG